MNIQQLLLSLYPYPSPKAPIKALLDFLNVSTLANGAATDIDKFQLTGIISCEQGQCRCICGRPILTVFQVSHRDYAISFGLGRECVKRFFPELSLRDVLTHQRGLDKLTQETEETLATGITARDTVFLDAGQYQLLSLDQQRRLSAGLPLTLKEIEALRVQLESRAIIMKRKKQALARKALALSGQEKTPEAFQFLLAKLEGGEEIKTLEALQQIDIATWPKVYLR